MESGGGTDWVLVIAANDQAPCMRDIACDHVRNAGGEPGVWVTLSETAPVYSGYLSFQAAQPAAAALREMLLTAGAFDFLIVPAAGFGRKQLLICDMDSTIIGQECIDELADFAGKRSQIEDITDRAMRGELDFEAALVSRVAMLSGLPLTALEKTLQERITLNPGARLLVRTMKKHGARTVLVSGGFTYFTSRVAALAGFDSHRGNRLLDDGIRLTGDVARPILGREAKRAALMEESAAVASMPSEAVAIGDGANDLDMICCAGLGIAYRAKPLVAAAAGGVIRCTDLRTALFYQGYHAGEFAGD